MRDMGPDAASPIPAQPSAQLSEQSLASAQPALQQPEWSGLSGWSAPSSGSSGADRSERLAMNASEAPPSMQVGTVLPWRFAILCDRIISGVATLASCGWQHMLEKHRR